MLRAAPKKRLGLCSALESTPPERILPGGRHRRVVGPGQAGDGVEQDHHVPLVLHQAAGLLDHHLRHLHVAGGRLVEGRGHHLALHRPLHVGDLLGPLVDEQHDEGGVGVVGGDGVRHVLQQHGLAGARRRDDQAALPLADGGEQVHHAGGHLGRIVLEVEPLGGVERREVVEEDLGLVLLGRLAVDGVHLEQGEVALAVLGLTHRAAHRVAGPQVEAADLRRGHIDVVGSGEVGEVRTPQEAEAVGQHLQRAVAADLHLLLGLLGRLGLGLEDGEDQVLLLHGAGGLDVEVARQLGQLGHLQVLQLGDVGRSVRGCRCGGGHVGSRRAVLSSSKEEAGRPEGRGAAGLGERPAGGRQNVCNPVCAVNCADSGSGPAPRACRMNEGCRAS